MNTKPPCVIVGSCRPYHNTTEDGEAESPSHRSAETVLVLCLKQIQLEKLHQCLDWGFCLAKRCQSSGKKKQKVAQLFSDSLLF